MGFQKLIPKIKKTISYFLTVLKCAAVVPSVTPGSRVAGELKRTENDDNYHKERAKQPEMKILISLRYAKE